MSLDRSDFRPQCPGTVKKCLKRYRIESVCMCVEPLKDYADFSWYDPFLNLIPSGFALVICDGPPGHLEDDTVWCR